MEEAESSQQAEPRPFDASIFQFTVIEKTEDPLQTRVLKTGIVHDFTIGEVRENIIALEKKKTEVESTAKIEAAKKENILRDMPEIANISREMLQIYYIYEKADAFCREALGVTDRINAALSEERETLKEIVKQTGLDLSHIQTDVVLTKVEKESTNDEPAPDPAADSEGNQ